MRDFAHLSIDNLDLYRITAAKNGTSATADPDFIIWQAGEIHDVSDSAAADQEAWVGILDPGEYVIELFNFELLFDSENDDQSACYDLTVTD